MPKLAYIFDQTLPAPTADSEQLMNTVAALSRRGYDCTLFLPASNESENTSPDALRAFYHVEGDFRLELLHSVFPGPRLLEKVVHPALCATLLRHRLRGFDLVYSRNIPALAAALACRVPVMYDTYRPWPAQYHHVLRPLFRALFADPLFLGAGLHSGYARDSYTAMGIPEDRTVVAHNGYNPAVWEPRLSQSEARQKLGLADDRPVAVYSGRMAPEKGVDSLLDLAERTPDCRFVFIGSHGQGPLEERAASLENVQIQGWLPFEELPAWLYAADILLLPFPKKMARNTVLPIKVYSYFAAGRAIFSPASDDTRELFEDGVNSCLVAPGGDILGRFQELVRDRDLREKIAQGAVESAKSLTWDARAGVLDGFIRRRLAEIGR